MFQYVCVCVCVRARASLRDGSSQNLWNFFAIVADMKQFLAVSVSVETEEGKNIVEEAVRIMDVT